MVSTKILILVLHLVYIMSPSLSADCGNSWPFTQDSGDDGWSDYGCVNVRECVNHQLSLLVSGSTSQISFDKHKVKKVYFRYGPSFYIDNLAFARQPILCKHNDKNCIWRL